MSSNSDRTHPNANDEKDMQEQTIRKMQQNSHRGDAETRCDAGSAPERRKKTRVKMEKAGQNYRADRLRFVSGGERLVSVGTPHRGRPLHSSSANPHRKHRLRGQENSLRPVPLPSYWNRTDSLRLNAGLRSMVLLGEDATVHGIRILVWRGDTVFRTGARYRAWRRGTGQKGTAGCRLRSMVAGSINEDWHGRRRRTVRSRGCVATRARMRVQDVLGRSIGVRVLGRRSTHGWRTFRGSAKLRRQLVLVFGQSGGAGTYETKLLDQLVVFC